MKSFSQTLLTNLAECWTGATVLERNTRLFQQNFLTKQPRESTYIPSVSDDLIGNVRGCLLNPKDKKVFGQLDKTKRKKAWDNLLSRREMDKTYMTENGKQEYSSFGLLVLTFRKSTAQWQKMQKDEVVLSVQPSTPTDKAQFWKYCWCWCIFNKTNIFDGITLYVMSNRIHLRKLSSLLGFQNYNMFLGREFSFL